MHMVVTKAVEVVEQIDPVALRGMTLLWFTGVVRPNSFDPKPGLAVIDSGVSKLADGELPVGKGWLQRLDMMNCIRYMQPSFQSVMKWQDMLVRDRPGYVCEGILAADADAIRARLNRVIPNSGSLVVEHAFLPDRFRINAFSSTSLLEYLDRPLKALNQAKANIPSVVLSQAGFQQPLETFGEKEALQSILTEARVDALSAEAIDRMLKYVESDLPDLQKMRSWWDGLEGFFEITPVGIAIAYSNARRFDELEGLSSLSEMIEIS